MFTFWPMARGFVTKCYTVEEVFILPNYCQEGLKNLANAIIISAVNDARKGKISQEDFRRFIFSDWALLLLRGATRAETIYKEVYPE